MYMILRVLREMQEKQARPRTTRHTEHPVIPEAEWRLSILVAKRWGSQSQIARCQLNKLILSYWPYWSYPDSGGPSIVLEFAPSGPVSEPRWTRGFRPFDKRRRQLGAAVSRRSGANPSADCPLFPDDIKP